MVTLQVENRPTVMADDEEAVQQVEGNRGEGEEVHSGDGFAMIKKKSQPPPSRFWIAGCSLHPSSDCPLRNVSSP